MRKLHKAFGAVFGIVLGVAAFVAPSAHAQNSAQDAVSGSTPVATEVAALKPLLAQQNTEAFHMGRNGNIDGWFVLADGKRVQLAYTTADGQNLLIGAMFDATGGNVTERQLIALREREPKVNALFTDTVDDARARLGQMSGLDKIVKGLDPQKKGDQLYLDVAQLFSVQIGDADAPVLFMFVDPNCPHCKRAWRDIEKTMKSTKLQVRLLPIGILGEESQRMAAMLLDKDSPADAWLAFAKADFSASALSGTPSENAKSKLLMNRTMFDRWELKATPFIIYRAKNGTVKVIDRVPNDMKAVVDDIAPQAK